jgi:hypothetical protein
LLLCPSHSNRRLTDPENRVRVVAQHDSVLNTGYLLNVLQRRFTNPASRLIWYDVRVCFNGQPESAVRACEAGATAWFSDWGYHQDDKIYARLTFNPYFDWQTSVMATVLARNLQATRR